MNTTLYNLENIRVNMTGADIAPNPCFCGVLLYTRSGLEGMQYAQWWATPSQHGYAVRIRTISGREFTSTHSDTWHLGLEVAVFAKTVL